MKSKYAFSLFLQFLSLEAIGVNGFLVTLPEIAYAWKYMSAWLLRVYMAASESLCEKTRYTCTHLKKTKWQYKMASFFPYTFLFCGNCRIRCSCFKQLRNILWTLQPMVTSCITTVYYPNKKINTDRIHQMQSDFPSFISLICVCECVCVCVCVYNYTILNVINSAGLNFKNENEKDKSE